jgi:hypothetical protein
MRKWTPGRYRWRTRLRGLMPSPLHMLVRKGKDDCGNHEWYKATLDVDHCYHCSVGVRTPSGIKHTGPSAQH